MMEQKKLVPKRRFEGFTSEWKIKKYNDLLDQSEGIRRGPFGSALKKEYFVPNSDYVVYEQQNAIYDKYNTRYNITKQKYDELYRFSINEDDFIMSGAGTIGRISRVPSGIKSGVINQALIRIRVNKQIVDLDYFLQWMRSKKMQNRLTQANPASAMVNLVPMSEVKEWEIEVPSIVEQQKIGQFFKHLDDMIALQQKKIDKTKALKSAYLADMFPAEGERVPKRRFAGYKNEWKVQALKDVVTEISDGDWILKEHIFEKGKYRIIQTGNLGIGRYIEKIKNAKYFHEEDFNQLKANEIFPGDILISRLAEPAGRTIILPAIGFRMVTSVDVTIIRPNEKFDSSFFMTQMNTEETLNKINLEVTGTTHKRISRKNLENIPLVVPEVSEQQKIGAFFMKIDETITNHQQKLEKLKAIKQAYLKEMFV